MHIWCLVRSWSSNIIESMKFDDVVAAIIQGLKIIRSSAYIRWLTTEFPTRQPVLHPFNSFDKSSIYALNKIRIVWWACQQSSILGIFFGTPLANNFRKEKKKNSWFILSKALGASIKHKFGGFLASILGHYFLSSINAQSVLYFLLKPHWLSAVTTSYFTLFTSILSCTLERILARAIGL